MKKKANNEGSIYKDSGGRWRGAVSIPQADGTLKRRYVSGRTKKEVTDKVRKLVSEIQDHVYTESCAETLQEWLCTWLEMYCKQEIRASTLINYETYIHKHISPALGRIRLSDLSTLQLQRFYNKLLQNGRLDGGGGINPKTLRNLHNMLHKALHQAVMLDMIPKNPADFVTLPKRRKAEMRYFTVEEQQKLQSCLASERLGMAILLDLYTGLRQGELLGLRWEDVHLDGEQSYLKVVQTIGRIKNEKPGATTKTVIAISQPKTPHSVRTIPILPEIAEQLEKHRVTQREYEVLHGIRHSGYVFTSVYGQPIDPRNFQRYFKELLKRHDIRVINVHGLRHTFATRALESGMSVKTLSQILGHSNVGFTLDTYAHVTEELKFSEMQGFRTFLGE